MNITLSGEPYRIKFGYSTIKGELYNTRSTYAELYKVNKDGTLSVVDSMIGFVSCDNRDRFVKETGRKMALKDLLEVITDKFNLTREDRGEIWNKYHSRQWGE